MDDVLAQGLLWDILRFVPPDGTPVDEPGWSVLTSLLTISAHFLYSFMAIERWYKVHGSSSTCIATNVLGRPPPTASRKSAFSGTRKTPLRPATRLS